MGLGVLQNSRSKGRQKFLDAARKGAKNFRGVLGGGKVFDLWYSLNPCVRKGHVKHLSHR